MQCTFARFRFSGTNKSWIWQCGCLRSRLCLRAHVLCVLWFNRGHHSRPLLPRKFSRRARQHWKSATFRQEILETHCSADFWIKLCTPGLMLYHQKSLFAGSQKSEWKVAAGSFGHQLKGWSKLRPHCQFRVAREQLGWKISGKFWNMLELINRPNQRLIWGRVHSICIRKILQLR